MSAKTQEEIQKKPKKHTLDSDEEESDGEEQNNRLNEDDFSGEEVSLRFLLFNDFSNVYIFRMELQEFWKETSKSLHSI